MTEFYITFEIEPTNSLVLLDQNLLMKCKPSQTIGMLKCSIINELLQFPKAARQMDDDMIHLLRFGGGAIITNDKAKLHEFGIIDGSVVSIRYERICRAIDRKYVYEIMNSDGGHLDIYSTLQKAKDALAEMNRYTFRINRIPLDTISDFDKSPDCVWDNVQ